MHKYDENKSINQSTVQEEKSNNFFEESINQRMDHSTNPISRPMFVRWRKLPHSQPLPRLSRRELVWRRVPPCPVPLRPPPGLRLPTSNRPKAMRRSGDNYPSRCTHFPRSKCGRVSRDGPCPFDDEKCLQRGQNCRNTGEKSARATWRGALSCGLWRRFHRPFLLRTEKSDQKCTAVKAERSKIFRENKRVRGSVCNAEYKSRSF